MDSQAIKGKNALAETYLFCCLLEMLELKFILSLSRSSMLAGDDIICSSTYLTGIMVGKAVLSFPL